MQGDQDRTSDVGEWGELAESFFERGDALSAVEDPVSGTAGHDEETENKPSSRAYAVLHAWILTRTMGARPFEPLWAALRHPRFVHASRIMLFSAAVNHCVVCVLTATVGV